MASKAGAGTLPPTPLLTEATDCVAGRETPGEVLDALRRGDRAQPPQEGAAQARRPQPAAGGSGGDKTAADLLTDGDTHRRLHATQIVVVLPLVSEECGAG